MKKVIRLLQATAKKIISSKTNIQIVLLIFILFVVSIPYFNQLRIKAVEWKVVQQRILENKIRIDKENKEREKRQEEIKHQEDLLTKYKITSLTIDDSTVYHFPDWIFTYVKNLKIIDTQKPYTCDNPPPLPSPTPKQYSFLSGFDDYAEKYKPLSSSKKTKREQFIADCEIIKKNENLYQSFQKEIVSIQDLIRDYKISTDKVESFLVGGLRSDLQRYNDLIGAGNGFIKVNPTTIKRTEKVTLEYGYNDLTNNEHLQSAITTVTVETPNKRKYTTVNGKIYPDDFNAPFISEEGVYWTRVERTVESTSGSKDILYSASSLFFVSDDLQ